MILQINLERNMVQILYLIFLKREKRGIKNGDKICALNFNI